MGIPSLENAKFKKTLIGETVPKNIKKSGRNENQEILLNWEKGDFYKAIRVTANRTIV